MSGPWAWVGLLPWFLAGITYIASFSTSDPKHIRDTLTLTLLFVAAGLVVGLSA